MKTIGYIYDHSDDPTDEDSMILKELKRKFKVVEIRTNDEYTLEHLDSIAKNCHLILNFSPSALGLEIAKEFEQRSKKLINPSNTYYWSENKWLFYVQCKKLNLPVPETILLSDNHETLKEELSHFLQSGPAVIKTVYGERGEFVSKAHTLKQALTIIKHFSERTKSPMIAQRFIPDDAKTYRITVIGGKVAQRIIKIGKHWKVKGFGNETMHTIKPDKKIDALAVKAASLVGHYISGIDLIKHNETFYLLEANGVPSFSLIQSDIPRLTTELVSFLKKTAK